MDAFSIKLIYMTLSNADICSYAMETNKGVTHTDHSATTASASTCFSFYTDSIDTVFSLMAAHSSVIYRIFKMNSQLNKVEHVNRSRISYFWEWEKVHKYKVQNLWLSYMCVSKFRRVTNLNGVH